MVLWRCIQGFQPLGLKSDRREGGGDMAKKGQCHEMDILFNIFTESQAGFPVNIFSVKIAALGSLKRVTGRIFKISKRFQRSKLKLLSLIYSIK